MKLVKVTGPLDQLNNFISTCCLDGSFHPEQATQYMSASMGYSTLSEENPYAPMLQKIEELIRENDSAPDPTIVGDRSREIQLDDKTSAYIDELDEKLSAMHDEYKELEDQLEQCRNGIAKYEHFTGFDVGLDELFNCKFIKTRFGHMPKESYEKLVAYDDDPYVLFIRARPMRQIIGASTARRESASTRSTASSRDSISSVSRFPRSRYR